MLLPYYIAAQNIEHEYYDLTGTYDPFGVKLRPTRYCEPVGPSFELRSALQAFL